MNNNQDKNNNYFSMMGLIKKDDIGSFYGEGMWHNFNSLEKVLKISTLFLMCTEELSSARLPLNLQRGEAKKLGHIFIHGKYWNGGG